MTASKQESLSQKYSILNYYLLAIFAFKQIANVVNLLLPLYIAASRPELGSKEAGEIISALLYSMCISLPLVGFLVSKIGHKNCVIFGTAGFGVSLVAFGLVIEMTKDDQVMVFLAVFCRIAMGICNGFILVSTSSLITIEFY